MAPIAKKMSPSPLLLIANPLRHVGARGAQVLRGMTIVEFDFHFQVESRVEVQNAVLIGRFDPEP
jgi:hypothetical protein